MQQSEITKAIQDMKITLIERGRTTTDLENCDGVCLLGARCVGMGISLYPEEGYSPYALLKEDPVIKFLSRLAGPATSQIHSILRPLWWLNDTANSDAEVFAFLDKAELAPKELQ